MTDRTRPYTPPVTPEPRDPREVPLSGRKAPSRDELTGDVDDTSATILGRDYTCTGMVECTDDDEVPDD